MNSFAELISKVNGAVLAIDYGEMHGFSDSVRGIAKHKFVKKEQLLELPGEIDLSAYVNFLALAESAKKAEGIANPQLMTQGQFLQNMGVWHRCEYLKQANEDLGDELEKQVLRLVGDEEMGDIYKFMYMGLEKNGDVFPFIKENDEISFV